MWSSSYFSQITLARFTVKLSGLWLVLYHKISSWRNKENRHYTSWCILVFSDYLCQIPTWYTWVAVTHHQENIYTLFLTFNHYHLDTNRIFLLFVQSCVCTDTNLRLCFGCYNFAIFYMIRLMPSSLPKFFYKYSRLSETLMLLVWIGQ